MNELFNLKILTNSGIQKMADIGFTPFMFIMICSLASSFLISHLYVKFYGSQGTGSTLHRAFPILGVAITAIFVCLQFSIPLSLGLLGALSIVRFRTPIKDPEEVGFILLIIASSITCATFNIPFLLLILSISLVGLIILKKDKKFFKKNPYEGVLILNFPTSVYDNNHENIFSTIKKDLKGSRIDSITENDDHYVVSYSFSESSEENLIKAKNEISKINTEIKTNIFFNQTHL